MTDSLSKSHEICDRLRDPEYVKVWERWQKARSEWRRLWWFAPRGTHPYRPDPEAMPDEALRKAAQEILDARKAYHEVCGWKGVEEKHA